MMLSSSSSSSSLLSCRRGVCTAARMIQKKTATTSGMMSRMVQQQQRTTAARETVHQHCRRRYHHNKLLLTRRTRTTVNHHLPINSNHQSSSPSSLLLRRQTINTHYQRHQNRQLSNSNQNHNNNPPPPSATAHETTSATTTSIGASEFHHNDIWAVYANLAARFVVAVSLAHCFSEYVAEITLCEGPSMHPTLKPAGEIVLIDKWTLRRLHRAAVKRQERRRYNATGDKEFLNQVLDDDALVADGEWRCRRALKRQREFEEAQRRDYEARQTTGQQKDNYFTDEWHEPRIPANHHDNGAASWLSSLWQLLTTPLSIGDVVVLEHPHRNGTVCKRVVGLPGDTVLQPRRGGFRNNANGNSSLLVIPDGHVWVEGDNPANSSDSRHYGTVPMTLIQGRVLCRVWPLRGQAILRRGAPPTPGGYTILPAGYEGQHIVKTRTARAAVVSDR